MRKKIYNILQRTYGIMMTISFFAGILPLIPFIVAIIIGGEWGGKISTFLYKEFYPWVILLGSIAIVVGLLPCTLASWKVFPLKRLPPKTVRKRGPKRSPPIKISEIEPRVGF